MTPKAKAKQLVKKYACLSRGENEKDWIGKNIVFSFFDIECAKILCDENIKFEKRISKQIKKHIELFNGMEFKQETYFWNEVKKEIEKL